MTASRTIRTPMPLRARRTWEPPSRQQRFASRGADVFVFMLGFGTLFSVHFIGDLYLSEILLVLAFTAIVFLRARRTLRPEFKIVYALMAFWLLGQTISDIYNHIPIIDRLRGAALIVFFAIDIIGFSILIGNNQRRKIIYLVGLTVGALAQVKLQPSPAAEDYPWKFGYAWGTMLAVMLVSSYFYGKRRYAISAFFVLGVCGVNVIMNYRSPILQLLLTLAVAYPIIPERLGALRVLPQSQFGRLIIVALLALGAAATANEVVQFVTRAGYLGEDAQEKNEAQEKAGNLLLGGRPEFVIGLRAALDSPILGHGSWAKDPKYYTMMYDAQVENEVSSGQNRGDILALEGNPLIPGHSHIVSAWIWSGIAGLVFWSYIFWLVLKGIARVAMLRPTLAPVYMWFLIAMSWDLFFSPFGANRRMVEAFVLVTLADILKEKAALRAKSWRRLGAGGRLRNRLAVRNSMRPGPAL